MKHEMKHEIKTQTHAAILTAALLLLGCARQPDPSSLSAGIPVPLEVRVEVAAQSRGVVTGTAFGHGSTIGIVLHDQGATTTYPDGTAMPYRLDQPTSDPGVWLATEPEGLLVSDPAEVFAYYPAPLPSSEGALSADKKHLEITLPSTLDLGALTTSTDFEFFWLPLKAGASASEIFVSKQETDFMTGRGTEVSTVTGGTKETTIRMKHALAMVVVYVKRNDKVTERPDVRQITLRNKAVGGPLVQGSFALTDNAFTPNATEASYTRTMSGFPIDVARYAMLVYPATMAEGAVEMELTTDFTSYTMPMPAKEWQSGRVYIYNVEISANEAQIGGVTLTDWPAWVDKPFELE